MCLWSPARSPRRRRRRTYDGLNVSDITLQDYIAVKPKDAAFLPHSAARYQTKRFRKAQVRERRARTVVGGLGWLVGCLGGLAHARAPAPAPQCPIVERLCNALMFHGRNNGKKLMAVRIVKHTFEIIHLLTDENPIQVLIQAIANAGPREDSTRVGSAGVVRRQAVDVSPFRRVNDALQLLSSGAREASFRTIKTIAECLADEIINAAKGSSNSYAIKKKDEIERVAKANR